MKKITPIMMSKEEKTKFNKVYKKEKLDFNIDDFLDNVTKDINELNQLIVLYQKAKKIIPPNRDDLINKLKAIVQYRELMISKYSDKYTSYCRQFSKKINEELFLAIKEECKGLGIQDMNHIVVQADPGTSNRLSKILTNMPPKVNSENKITGGLLSLKEDKRDVRFGQLFSLPDLSMAVTA